MLKEIKPRFYLVLSCMYCNKKDDYAVKCRMSFMKKSKSMSMFHFINVSPTSLHTLTQLISKKLIYSISEREAQKSYNYVNFMCF